MDWSDDDLDREIPRPNAAQLPAKVLEEELRRRNLRVSGFTDDVKLLQLHLDEEWALEVEQLNQLRRARDDARQKQADAVALEQRLRAEQQEEVDAVARDPKLSYWIELAQGNKTPAHMSVRDVEPIGLRAFVKSLAHCTTLRSLDVCHCGLKDDVGFGVTLGATLAAAADANISSGGGGGGGLRDIALDGNGLGPPSVLAICDGILSSPAAASAAKSLSLEGNPIGSNSSEPDMRVWEALGDLIAMPQPEQQ